MQTIKEELSELGLSEFMLERAHIPQECLEKLRDRLKRLTRWRHLSAIPHSSYLEFLSGQFNPSSLPELLSFTVSGSSIIEYVALIEDIELLEIIRLHNSEVMRDHMHQSPHNIAILAAGKGLTNVLTWIYMYFPDLLESIDRFTEYNIFLEAVAILQPETLKWIWHHYPEAFHVKIEIISIFLRVHLIERKLDAFNDIIKNLQQYLSEKELNKILLKIDCSDKDLLDSLSNALDTNTIITDISLSSPNFDPDDEQKDKVREKLYRNKTLASAYKDVHAMIEIRNILQINLRKVTNHFALYHAISCHDILINVMAYYCPPNNLFPKDYREIAKKTSVDALRFQQYKTYILGTVESKIQRDAESDTPNPPREMNGKLLPNAAFLKLFKARIATTQCPADIQAVRKSFGLGQN